MYVVGDIHGRVDLLAAVHQRIDEDKVRTRPERTVEIYLGDYVDRGPDPAGVVSRLIERGQSTYALFLRGNHEQLLLDFLDGRDCLEQWQTLGGIATMLSYGVPTSLLSRPPSADAVRASLIQALPEAHKTFYQQTGSYVRASPYLAVHAGVRPGVTLEDQTVGDLLGIRQDFLDFQGDLGFIVVHGHTPVMTPDLRRNRINIDTGAFATNRLTCLRIGEDGAQVLGDEGTRTA
jgi:serine/threonine protein phosphatase 1